MNTRFAHISPCRWFCSVLLSLCLLAPAKAQTIVLEVDLHITTGGKKPTEAQVTLHNECDSSHVEIFQADYSGKVFFALPGGCTYRAVIEADKGLPKVLLFDTREPKAKSDTYPCDVDLAVVSKKRQVKFEDGIPVGVIRWNKGKRKWGHDAEYTREMQEAYRRAASGKSSQ